MARKRKASSEVTAENRHKIPQRKWDRVALGFAREMHEENFQSRRGTFGLEDVDCVVVYNNNPWADYPTLRDEETADFRILLDRHGIKELAYATYPPPGHESEGYTYAMILDARMEQEGLVRELMRRVLDASFEWMDLQQKS
jgi:hypothetical protein